ncbi:hypothetical protein ANANG_G00183200 [Anguilla anguilla]|uniref:Uncharacterized protein n=1 Tax=Anguilla anguilla TaxID=7936 RepID=A0A9D3M8Y0_ANGAN|nr:hypothetical protein ANANG_G00183200 [Anguilla anguilla]
MLVSLLRTPRFTLWLSMKTILPLTSAIVGTEGSHQTSPSFFIIFLMILIVPLDSVFTLSTTVSLLCLSRKLLSMPRTSLNCWCIIAPSRTSMFLVKKFSCTSMSKYRSPASNWMLKLHVWHCTRGPPYRVMLLWVPGIVTAERGLSSGIADIQSTFRNN